MCASNPDIHTQLQRAVDEERERYDFPSCILHVVAPSAGLEDTFAAGYREVASRTPITGDECYRIASITKTFTASAILRLMELGKLELDASITEVLPEEFVGVVAEYGYDPGRITVRHVLQHTAGLREAADMEDVLGADPVRRWTPLEHLRACLHRGGPLTAPGEAFLYCDGGYTLLGRVVERASGLPQVDAFRSLIPFNALGLTQTWFESLEDPPPNAPPQAHQYWRGRDITPFDPSLDLYGGGGLLSTGKDLTRFFRALLAGRVFDRPGTLEMMLTVPDLPDPTRQYGLGIQRNTVEGIEMWGHRGAWGSACFHAPEIDMTFAYTRNMNISGFPPGYEEFGLAGLLIQIHPGPAQRGG